MSHEPVLVFSPKGIDPEEFFIKQLQADEHHEVGGRFSGLLGDQDEGVKSEFNFKEIAKRLVEEGELDDENDPITMHLVDIKGQWHTFDIFDLEDIDRRLFWKLVNSTPAEANVALIDWHY